MSKATLTGDIRARVSEETETAIEELADERSEPGDRTYDSDVVRDALASYEPLQPYLNDEK